MSAQWPSRLKQPGSTALAFSDDPASACAADDGAGAEPTNAVAEALAAAVVRDVIAMGVGAVIALHSVDEARASVALARTATRYQVSVYDLVQAMLSLVSGTAEPLDDRAGRAAAQLLLEGLDS
jgi:hypothetical protein